LFPVEQRRLLNLLVSEISYHGGDGTLSMTLREAGIKTLSGSPDPKNAPGMLTFKFEVHSQRMGKEVVVRKGPKPPPKEPTPKERVPRITRLLALAHHFQDLLDTGAATDMAELANAAGISRARASQVMNLLMLAPDIQEEILLLPPTTSGTDPVTEREVRTIAGEPLWNAQRRAWLRLRQTLP
jgi:hypothetical protein